LTLLKAGADVNTNNGGFTPLTYACAAGDLAKVTALLKAGAKTNPLTTSGHTPLMHAVAIAANAQVVTALLKAGADPNYVMPHSGMTALMYLVKNWAKGPSDKERQACFDALRKAKAGVNLADGRGRTALHYAVLGKSPAAVQALLAAKADVRRQDHQGQTPLDLARKGKKNPTVDALRRATGS
jgi:ankyrin repeat protein